MKAAAHHIVSLDAFRGITIASMIVVNNPGTWSAVFDPLLHSRWNGCTFADLVFPCFIFIVGVAIPFAFARRLASGYATALLYRRMAVRCLGLCMLGLVLNAAASGFWDLSALRLPGVLQRIAIVYLFAAVFFLQTSATSRAFLTALLLGAHSVLVMWMPDISARVDAAVFGGHMQRPVDPEGLVSTIPALATALLGVAAGDWLRREQDDQKRTMGLLLGGAAGVIVGLLSARILPLNKALWTGSFAVLTAGAAAIGLGLCYAAIAVHRAPAWSRPFVWLGVNPLPIYFLSELTGHLLDRFGGKEWLFWIVMRPLMARQVSDRGASLLFAGAFTLVWVALARVFYRRAIRIHI